ncbi:hypothetical protein O2K51_12640 [Apibacter raozihei]|uniref:hypothetical protein n=1 Tax=Apibacter raozihei TaxID=2500547 RepID=UPI000FE2C343|nr:hypothetical protein [Apibacter raozihei]
MKQKIFVLSALLFTSLSFSQIGINNQSPNATLDISAIKSDGSTAEGIIAPRLTGDQIKAANPKYGINQTGAIIYATSGISAADPTDKTTNITTAGYYFFNGSTWELLNPQTTDSDATRFLGGTVYVKFNSISGGTLTSTKVIGGASGTSYTVGGSTQLSSKGGINSLIGNGFTISNPSNGVFDIKLDTPMTEIYGISLNIVDAYGPTSGSVNPGQSPDPNTPGIKLKTNDNCQVAYLSNNLFRLKTGDDAGTLANRPFTFLIIGN